MNDHVLGVVKGDEREKELRIAHDDSMLRKTAPRLAQKIATLIESRTVEAETAGTEAMQHQLEGYIMALQDLYLAVSGYSLDVGNNATMPGKPGRKPF